MNRLLCLLLLTTLASPAAALVPINEDPRIAQTLIAGRVGDIIRKTCPTMRARMLVVLSKLNDLEDYARGQGYTEGDLKAFREDKAEKAKMYAVADDYLAAAGAVPGDPESYCRVGRDEIANETLTGSLLRSTE